MSQNPFRQGHRVRNTHSKDPAMQRFTVTNVYCSIPYNPIPESNAPPDTSDESQATPHSKNLEASDETRNSTRKKNGKYADSDVESCRQELEAMMTSSDVEKVEVESRHLTSSLETSTMSNATYEQELQCSEREVPGLLKQNMMTPCKSNDQVHRKEYGAINDRYCYLMGILVNGMRELSKHDAIRFCYERHRLENAVKQLTDDSILLESRVYEVVKLYDRYTEILADDEQKYLNWSRLVSVREDIDQILDICRDGIIA